MGTYLKTSITRNSAEALKTFNSLNIKPSSTSNYTGNNKIGNLSSSTMQSETNGNATKARQQSTSLAHRHSNPGSSYSTMSSSNNQHQQYSSNHHQNHQHQMANGSSSSNVSASASAIKTANRATTNGQSTNLAASNDPALPRIRINS